MAEAITLGLFTLQLFVCVILKIEIMYALGFGLLIFLCYGIFKKVPVKTLAKECLKSVLTVRNVLTLLLMIGTLTSLWRASGTIPYIIFHTTKLISPKIFLLAAFLLCGLISTLTGTCFGTAATVGVISMTMANAMGVNSLLAGGAILSGCFLGDRCSPTSSSANLVAELTHTKLYDNIPKMLKTCAVPFLITCGIYLVLSFGNSGDIDPSSAVAIFGESFNLSVFCLVPVSIIIIFAVLKISGRLAIIVSIGTAILVCIFAQQMGALEIFKVMIFGFKTENAELASLIAGGGAISMVSPVGIVAISAFYSGIFEATGLLENVISLIIKMAEKLGEFTATVITSVLTSMLGFNQTLSIMLSHQLCKDVYGEDESGLAIALENSVVLMAGLVPWSIAGSVPLLSVGATNGSMAFSFYLIIVPLWGIFVEHFKKKKK